MQTQKPHLLESYGVLKFNNVSSYMNTEVSEEYHKELVQLPFQSTSAKTVLLNRYIRRNNEKSINKS